MNQVDKFLHTHGLYMLDLNLQERYEARRGNLTKLKALLEDRGVLLCPGLQQKEFARPAIAEEWAQEYFQDPYPLEDAQGITCDQDKEEKGIPCDAELFFDDGEYAFYLQPDAALYITESLSNEVAEEDPITQMIRKEVKMLDTIAEAVSETRANLIDMMENHNG